MSIYDGLGAKESTKRFEYYQIINGRIAQTAKNLTPELKAAGYEIATLVHRKTGAETKKVVKFFDELYGFVHNIDYHTNDALGFSSWRLHLDVGKPYYLVLSLGAQSPEARRLVMTAPNFDFSLPLHIRCWHDAENDRTAVAFKQDEFKVPQFFTRENRNGLPEPRERPNPQGGKPKYDWTEIEDFLFQFITENVVPRIQNENIIRQQMVAETMGDEGSEIDADALANSSGGGDDDIPF